MIEADNCDKPGVVNLEKLVPDLGQCKMIDTKNDFQSVYMLLSLQTHLSFAPTLSCWKNKLKSENIILKVLNTPVFPLSMPPSLKKSKKEKTGVEREKLGVI